jgi:hypothetical protein
VLADESSRPEPPAVHSEWRVGPARPSSQLAPFALGRNRLAVAPGRDADRQLVIERLEPHASFDLAEPFARIREAIEEAHRTSRAA